MKRSNLTLLTYHLTTIHYGTPQRNLKDQQLLFHRLENKTEAEHEQLRENQPLHRLSSNSLYTKQ
jgi:hypothetical protein